MIIDYMLFKANIHLLHATLKPVPSVEAGGPTTTPNPRTHTLFSQIKMFQIILQGLIHLAVLVVSQGIARTSTVLDTS